jgi:anti-anti-sigma regulatory factor
MTMHVIRGDEVAQIVVIGDLRAPESVELIACLIALAERGARRLIVDLERADFVNAAAYGALVETAARLGAFGAALTVTGGPGRARRRARSHPGGREHGCAVAAGPPRRRPR